VLKTLKDSELQLLLDPSLSLLSNYYRYMTDSEDTLLSKFYGIYTISMENMQDITCFIMDNLLGEDFMNIERIYDLKGSTVGRIVKIKKDQ